MTNIHVIKLNHSSVMFYFVFLLQLLNFEARLNILF